MTLPLPAALAEVRESGIPEGTTVFRQGQACTHYLLVTEGSVRVFARSASGKEVVLYHVGPGEICVITTSCLLSDVPYPAEAVAETEVRVKVIAKSEFDRLLATSPAFREFVFAAFGGRLVGLISLVEQIALESIQNRLAAYLLRRSRDGGAVTATHQEMAETIGSAREVVSRTLKSFAALGLVRVARGRLEVLDRAGLAERAAAPTTSFDPR